MANSASCPRIAKWLQAGLLCGRTLGRPPATSAGHPSAGFTGYGRLLCGDFRPIPARGPALDEKKPAVVMSNTYADLQVFTGATRLEPATSGVTGVPKTLNVAKSRDAPCTTLLAGPTFAEFGVIWYSRACA
jgi:hypothetical protein